MKPILFSTPMVQALLAGRKTQTRRVMKHPKGLADVFGHMAECKQPFMKGDILWVRETWKKVCATERYYEGGKYVSSEELFGYMYRADNLIRWDDREPKDDEFHLSDITRELKWRPSIHMPREAARIFLRVTAVRVERLQDSFNAPITPILAVQAEGIDIGDTCRECLETYTFPCCVEALDDDGTTLGECGMLDENRGEFSDLWDSTIKKRDLPRLGWTGNPWVWVFEFERCEEEAE